MRKDYFAYLQGTVQEPPRPRAPTYQWAQNKEEIPCCICMELIQDTIPTAVLRCEHQMHQECLTHWFKTLRENRRTTNCPACREVAQEEELLITYPCGWCSKLVTNDGYEAQCGHFHHKTCWELCYEQCLRCRAEEEEEEDSSSEEGEEFSEELNRNKSDSYEEGYLAHVNEDQRREIRNFCDRHGCAIEDLNNLLRTVSTRQLTEDQEIEAQEELASTPVSRQSSICDPFTVEVISIDDAQYEDTSSRITAQEEVFIDDEEFKRITENISLVEQISFNPATDDIPWDMPQRLSINEYMNVWAHSSRQAHMVHPETYAMIKNMNEDSSSSSSESAREFASDELL